LKRCGFVTLDARSGELCDQPFGRNAGSGACFALTDRRRSVGRTVEQGFEVGIALDHRQHGGAAIGWHRPAEAHSLIDQLAHGTAVLRPRIAARLEIFGDQPVRRRTLAACSLNNLVEQFDSGLNACGWGHM
jgi:hypothetical protein